MTVDIEVVRAPTDEMVRALGRLLPQLSSSAGPVTAASVREVVDRPGTHLLVARVDGEIAGILTLVTFATLTGRRAWIEDVVVDEATRGRGVGAALTLEAVRLARATGATTVDLTSRPSRVAANRLYVKLGFQLRESNLYRYTDPAPG